MLDALFPRRTLLYLIAQSSSSAAISPQPRGRTKRTWYAKVLDLWWNADPELQPTVARIRSAMAALGASRH